MLILYQKVSDFFQHILFILNIVLGKYKKAEKGTFSTGPTKESQIRVCLSDSLTD